MVELPSLLGRLADGDAVGAFEERWHHPVYRAYNHLGRDRSVAGSNPAPPTSKISFRTLSHLIDLPSNYESFHHEKHESSNSFGIIISENPLGPGPKAKEAIVSNVDGIQFYPSKKLREEFEFQASSYIGLPKESVRACDGAEEAISVVSQIFLNEETNAVVLDPSFPRFAAESRIQGASLRLSRLRELIHLDLADVLSKIDNETGVVWIATPNNPTGTIVKPHEVEKIATSLSGGVVVCDEAYAEFGGISSAGIVKHYDNVIVIRTLSKAFGLAGMRIGYLMSSTDILKLFDKVQRPMSICYLSLKAGVEALKHESHMLKNVHRVMEMKEKALALLSQNEDVRIKSSIANFVVIEIEGETSIRSIMKKLRKKGLMCRFTSLTYLNP